MQVGPEPGDGVSPRCGYLRLRDGYIHKSIVMETWDLWFPSMGATGVSYARSRVESEVAGDRVLVHAAPPKLDVVVRDKDGKVAAAGYGLERQQPGPMSFLVRSAGEVRLQDSWPS